MSQSSSNRPIVLLRTGRDYHTSQIQQNELLSKATPESIIDECLKIRESVQTLNDQFKGPLEKSAQKNTILPFVFLLGNHSAGKSSFINYVCGRKVRHHSHNFTTGTAFHSLLPFSVPFLHFLYHLIPSPLPSPHLTYLTVLLHYLVPLPPSTYIPSSTHTHKLRRFRRLESPQQTTRSP